MPTVIDSLIVKLELDPSGFTQGQKDASNQVEKFTNQIKKSHEAVAKSAKDTGIGFEEATRKALGFFAVVAGGRGMEELFVNSVQTSAAIGRLAGNINMSTSALSGWENAAKGAGGTAEGIAQTLTNISQAFQMQTLGIPTPIMTGLQTLGLPTADANGNPLSPDQIAIELANKFASMPKAQALAYAGLMNIDQGTFNFLDQGGRAVAAQVKANTNTTDAQAKAAEQLQKDYAQLESQVEGLANKLMVQAMPAIDSFSTSLLKFINGFENSGLYKLFVKLNQPATTLNNINSDIKKGEDWFFNLPSSPSNPFPNLGESLGMRNNNPGNLRYVGQPGAHADANGFAVFGTMQDGIAAMKAQIGLDGSRGKNTIASLITSWSGGSSASDTGAGNPDHNNIAAYVAAVSGATGIAANAPLNMSDPYVQQVLAMAIAQHEGTGGAFRGAPLSARVNNVLAGLRGAKTLKSDTARSAPVTIGTVNVHAASADPKKVVSQMGKTLGSSIMAHTANTGLA